MVAIVSQQFEINEKIHNNLEEYLSTITYWENIQTEGSQAG